MRVHVGVGGDEAGEGGTAVPQRLRRDLDHARGLRDLRPRLGQQGHAVPQGGEPAHQRDHVALNATVALHRQAMVRRHDDVHRGPS
jgi:hypothetical protein